MYFLQFLPERLEKRVKKDCSHLHYLLSGALCVCSRNLGPWKESASWYCTSANVKRLRLLYARLLCCSSSHGNACWNSSQAPSACLASVVFLSVQFYFRGTWSGSWSSYTELSWPFIPCMYSFSSKISYVWRFNSSEADQSYFSSNSEEIVAAK